MKLEKFKPPELRLIPENDDDLYILSNGLRVGDKVISRTSRKIKMEETDSTKRETVTIGVVVEKIEYNGYGDNLRVRGPIFQSSDPQVPLSSYHSLTIKPRQSLTIIRDDWTDQEIELLNNPSDQYLGHLVLIVIDDESATIAQLGRFATQIVAEIPSDIPRKVDPDQYQEMKHRFFEKIANTLLDLQKTKSIRKVFVGGPGFTREELMDFLTEKYPDLRKNTVTLPLKNSGRGGIKELLNDDILSHFDLAEQVQKESKFMEYFFETLAKEERKVTYGFEETKRAVQMGAVEQLAVVDDLMKGEAEIRRTIEQLLEENSRFNGQNVIISNSHPFADQLKALGGIAALLRFPLPEP